MKDPREYYEFLIQKSKIQANPEQEKVLQYLTTIQKKLILRQHRQNNFLWGCLQYFKSTRRPIKGLYLWGSVGIGKTLLMDCFYQSLDLPQWRCHFHEFIQHLHQELNAWRGKSNPLIHIGQCWAKQYRVICFDEFLVTDPGDAVILTELFKVLFKYGVCLVATSNVAPDRLYEKGSQPQLFRPMIQLIHQHTEVIHLSLSEDYRRRLLEKVPVYYQSKGKESEHALWNVAQQFTDDHSLLTSKPLELLGREISVKQRTGKVIWFDFKVICGRPRSQQDYLLLTKMYKVILISDVPCLAKSSADFIVSFINLIDILYEARTFLILSAAVPIDELYPQGPFRKIFQRTESRLLEMQTKNYIIGTSL